MKIITDHKWKHFLYGYELTDKEKEDFDYIEDIDGHDFFRYRGRVYDVGEFLVNHNDLFPQEWDGYTSDSFFSGILLKIDPETNMYQVGTYIS